MEDEILWIGLLQALPYFNAVLVVRPHFYELSCVTMDKRQLTALKFSVRKQVRVLD